MKTNDMELVCGSGNVYHDFDSSNAGLEQASAIEAAARSAVRRMIFKEASCLFGRA